MTIERRILVGLRDIKALSFECNKCHARISVSPDAGKVPAYQCPECEHPWRGSDAYTNKEVTTPYVALVKAISTLRSLNNNAEGFTILLEFEEPKA